MGGSQTCLRQGREHNRFKPKRLRSGNQSGLRWPCPRSALSIRCLEGGDARGVAVGQVDIVPAVEQLVAADRIDAESETAVATRDCLLFEIDGDGHVRIGGNRSAELDYIGFRQRWRQQPVLDRVLREDVAE